MPHPTLAHDDELAYVLSCLAQSKGCSVTQIALAWVHARGQGVAPLIDARARGHLTGAPTPPTVELDDVDLMEIESALPGAPAFDQP